MSLTLGNGPLSRREDAGETNATIDGPAHLLWFHEVAKRVRVVVAGQVVADTERARLLHETRLLPVYYLPRDDVRFDLLEPSATRTHCPFKGDARYWDLRVGDRVVRDAAWGYDDPVPGAPDLAPYLAFYGDRVDQWFEEDVEVFGHPRDPFHRVDVCPSSRRVVVRVDGDVVAETDRPVLLFETGLPVRYYLPEAAWRSELLLPAERTTYCPYKGTADYRSVRSPRSGDVLDAALWRYADPLDESRGIAGLWSVDQGRDRIEVEVSSGAG
jgi:uncharacterized protein (DUF427 family)